MDQPEQPAQTVRQHLAKADAEHRIHHQPGGLQRLHRRLRILHPAIHRDRQMPQPLCHLHRDGGAGHIAGQNNADFGVLLQQLAGDDKAVAAVVAAAAQNHHRLSGHRIVLPDHPRGGAARVFHHSRIIQSAFVGGGFCPPHLVCVENRHHTMTLLFCYPIRC